MHDGPGECEEIDVAALERKIDEVPLQFAVSGIHRHQQNSRLHVHQGIAARVGDAKLQTGSVLVRSDDRVLAVNDASRGPGKAAIEEPGGDRKNHQTGGGFERRDGVGQRAFGINIAVSDGGQGVDAEEERVGKSAHVGLESFEVFDRRSSDRGTRRSR